MSKETKKETKQEVKKGTVVNFQNYPVRVAVFDKQDRNISVKIERTYKDADGKYQNSSNLFIDDLPKLITVLQDIVSQYAITKSEPTEFDIK